MGAAKVAIVTGSIAFASFDGREKKSPDKRTIAVRR
jgi:hypothetical protein